MNKMGVPFVAAASHLVAHEGAERAVMIDRITRSGHKIWYRLKVIQQPERARACGSGPKSSADRRPVDPPPVVELKIFEGPTEELALQRDITFYYNANFFLFATLEHSRVMAHGRVQTPLANAPPVLTGMPVSGMAYLDRPEEAGYFLFPDLSVRHEGRYRFTFHLYEETKDDKDKDPETAAPELCSAGACDPHGGSFDYVTEIKSQDFTVFSAKKFPGLAESTSLSRCVADQGCRVRIRRDVRMRRRDGKPNSRDAPYENKEEDDYAAKCHQTPEVACDPYGRARSMSASTERTPCSATSERRLSVAENPPPQPGPPSHAARGHLDFTGANPGSQYPAQPQARFAQPPLVPSVPSHPPLSARTPVAYARRPSYKSPAPPPPHAPERSPSRMCSHALPSPSREGPLETRRESHCLPPLTLPSPNSFPTPPPSTSGKSLSNLALPSISQMSGVSSDVPPPPQPSLPLASPHSTGPAQLNGLPVHFTPSRVSGIKRVLSYFTSQDNISPRRNGERDSGFIVDPDEDIELNFTRADGRQDLARYHYLA